MSTTEKNKTSPASLRDLALAKSGAYRTAQIVVPEWQGVTVTLREPSGEAWLRFREIITPDVDEGDEPTKLTQAETFLRNKAADVAMFIDVLLDEKGDPVFSDEDKETVSEIYGPVHARLLSEALKLGMSQEVAEKK